MNILKSKKTNHEISFFKNKFKITSKKIIRFNILMAY